MSCHVINATHLPYGDRSHFEQDTTRARAGLEGPVEYRASSLDATECSEGRGSVRAQHESRWHSDETGFSEFQLVLLICQSAKHELPALV